jgi:hypothetical protein
MKTNYSGRRASAAAYLCGLITASLFLTAAPAEAITYHYDDTLVFGQGLVATSNPSYSHSFSGTYEISASVTFDSDTSNTSGTFFIGGPEISSASLCLVNTNCVPVQGSVTLTLGRVTNWDLSGSCSNNCLLAVPPNANIVSEILAVETSSSLDSFSWAYNAIMGSTNYMGDASGSGEPIAWHTPVPGAAPLFATGLGALSLLLRRGKRKPLLRDL